MGKINWKRLGKNIGKLVNQVKTTKEDLKKSSEQRKKSRAERAEREKLLRERLKQREKAPIKKLPKPVPNKM